MAGCDSLDFSGLFKLETLVHTEVAASCFHEVGLKRLVALAGGRTLELLCFTAAGDRAQKTCEWDFNALPIQCMCVEPSGTWLLAASESQLSLVPFLPRLHSDGAYDRRWPLDEVTSRPLTCGRLAAVSWWLTRQAENIAIVAQESGTILFYSLDSEAVVKEAEVPGRIADVQICVDDSLDLITLLVTGTEQRYWKLVLEHRSNGYNWVLEPAGRGGAGRMREGLMAYLKDSVFQQGPSQEATAGYSPKPTAYEPPSGPGGSRWSITVQYVSGRHFITAFDLDEGTMVLESTEAAAEGRSLRARVASGALYRQALYSPRLLYVLADGALEVHSTALAAAEERARETCVWRAPLLGSAARAHVLSAPAARAAQPGWREPTFLCDLRLPRFALEPCLLLTTQGAFLLTTMAEPSEWLVGVIMRGGQGARRAAEALGAPVAALLSAAADMLLSRSKLQPAQYLYSLSQGPPDGWVARLAVFGRWSELATFKLPPNSSPPLGGAASALRVLAQLMCAVIASNQPIDLDTQCENVSPAQLEDVCCAAAALGLWRALPEYSVRRGAPQLLLAAAARGRMCGGALRCLLAQPHLFPCALEVDAGFLYRHLIENCGTFDTDTLKRACVWLSPLREEWRPVLRDLQDGRTTVYTSRLVELIGAFARLLAEVDARSPLTSPPTAPRPRAARSEPCRPGRVLAAGLAHWAATAGGAARVLLADTPAHADLHGRALGVACGRHHTVLLTENGVYCAGDNLHGQLGVGAAWGRAAGEGARAGGALLRARAAWDVRAVAVAAGHYHSAALDAGGRLYTWGWGVHGQLGLGSTDDSLQPRLVTRLQGRKVTAVGCGAYHTAALLRGGEVWAFGGDLFGQLGVGSRSKAGVPVRVALLPGPVVKLAVGYFHNLALTERGELWTWGASPQSVRAAATQASRAASAEPSAAAAAAPEPDAHLRPAPLDAAHCGRIVQISAGWHHSCLLNESGAIFSWGLNFSGQLGTGDRKRVTRPTEVQLSAENAPLGTERAPASAASDVACGGEFTVLLDQHDNVFVVGNTRQPSDDEAGKQSNRFFMMKTTRRVIKIPANRSGDKFRFQYFDRLHNLLPPSTVSLQREMLVPDPNPLACPSDFQNENTMDVVLDSLKPWIHESDVASSPNLAARLAYHNKMYSDCLKFQLEAIKTVGTFKEKDQIKSEVLHVDDISLSLKREERKKIIITVVGKNIKDIGLAILNEQPYPDVPKDAYKNIPCSCEELELYRKTEAPEAVCRDESKTVLASKAAQVIDNAMSTFPMDSDSWGVYLRLVKEFFLENSLPNTELELVLSKYTEGSIAEVSSAVMFSEDSAGYSEILSPKFYLTICSQLLDTWV